MGLSGRDRASVSLPPLIGYAVDPTTGLIRLETELEWWVRLFGPDIGAAYYEHALEQRRHLREVRAGLRAATEFSGGKAIIVPLHYGERRAHHRATPGPLDLSDLPPGSGR